MDTATVIKKRDGCCQPCEVTSDCNYAPGLVFANTMWVGLCQIERLQRTEEDARATVSLASTGTPHASTTPSALRTL